MTLKRATNPRTGGYHPQNWTHESDTFAVPFFKTSYMVSSCFSAHSCVFSVSRHKLSLLGTTKSPLRLDKPYEFSRTPRSASATEGCQEGPRESRGDRVMSHDNLNCPEASTWHVQLFLSCWSSRTFLSSGLRRSSLSYDLELRVHSVCPLLARHRLAIWRVVVSRPWYAPYFLSLHCSGFNFFLDSLMSHQTLTARQNQLLLQVGQAQ